jgi:hypothetical protein
MDTIPNMSDLLHRSEIFKGLTSEQFTGLLKKGQRIKLQPKSILFNQGDLAKSCFLVSRGRVKNPGPPGQNSLLFRSSRWCI